MSAPVPVGPSSIDPQPRGLPQSGRPAARANADAPDVPLRDAFVPSSADSAAASRPAIAVPPQRPVAAASPQPAVAAAPPPYNLPAPTMGAVRTALAYLDFPALDPFAASVASVVWAGMRTVLSGKTEYIEVPGAMRKPLSVELNLKNGKDAPMLLILPGLGGGRLTAQVRALKHEALDRGMNYTVIPSPWSSNWLDAEPVHAPGNLPKETEVVRSVLHSLQERHPGFYDRVSAAGYSYGGLLGASVVAHDRDPGAGARTVQGSFVALSPPQNLLDSMRALDGLRNQYEPPDNLKRVLAMYGVAVPYYGFERIGESPVARRPETNAEKYLADTMASRDHLQEVVERYPVTSGANPLPRDPARASNGRPATAAPSESLAARPQAAASPESLAAGAEAATLPETPDDAQAQRRSDVTFAQYVDGYLAPDLKATDPHSTVEQLARENSYINLLARASGRGVPVLTLAAADDYILDADDVIAMRGLESNPAPDQAARVLDHGGHVGALFNPQARDQMYAFLAQPPSLSTP